MNKEVDLEEIKQKIEVAREHIKSVMRGRVAVARALTGTMIADYEIEFPDPDIAHVYQVMFSRRVGDPVVFRLSFGSRLKWVGVSHPWGLKPADIEVKPYVKDS